MSSLRYTASSFTRQAKRQVRQGSKRGNIVCLACLGACVDRTGISGTICINLAPETRRHCDSGELQE